MPTTLGTIPYHSVAELFAFRPRCGSTRRIRDQRGPGSLAPERRAAAPHRRHHDLVAPAGAAVDLGTGAKAEVLAHADAHLAQSPAVAGDRDGVTAEARIDCDEGLLDLGG